MTPSSQYQEVISRLSKIIFYTHLYVTQKSVSSSCSCGGNSHSARWRLPDVWLCFQGNQTYKSAVDLDWGTSRLCRLFVTGCEAAVAGFVSQHLTCVRAQLLLGALGCSGDVPHVCRRDAILPITGLAYGTRYDVQTSWEDLKLDNNEHQVQQIDQNAMQQHKRFTFF